MPIDVITITPADIANNLGCAPDRSEIRFDITVTPDGAIKEDSSDVQTEEKAVTPAKTLQIVRPSAGKYLSQVTVNAIPNEYIIPTGSLNINQNGTDIDVRSKATVNVNVPTISEEIYLNGEEMLFGGEPS